MNIKIAKKFILGSDGPNQPPPQSADRINSRKQSGHHHILPGSNLNSHRQGSATGSPIRNDGQSFISVRDQLARMENSLNDMVEDLKQSKQDMNNVRNDLQALKQVQEDEAYRSIQEELQQRVKEIEASLQQQGRNDFESSQLISQQTQVLRVQFADHLKNALNMSLATEILENHVGYLE